MKKTLGLIAAVALLGCGDIDVPDLNNPSVDALEKTPTRSAVMAASTGLIIGSRAGLSATNGYVSQLGVLGREAYNFDTNDPRYVQELLESPELDPGSPAFGGNFWVAPYRNLKNARTVLAALENPTLKGMTEAEKQAIRGFTNTMSALDYLQIITTRDSAGAVDAHGEPDAKGLYPMVSKEAIYARIVQLLDDAVVQLKAGGEEFPFPLSTGFEGFDTPATFLKFNRALRARVAAYLQDWDGVLTALEGPDRSFLDADLTAANAAAKLQTGVYFTFTTDSGDITNGLNSAVLYVHPSVVTEAEVDPETNLPDARVTEKTEELAAEKIVRGLSSKYAFTKYTKDTPLPIIRNEELILLRAEAHIGKGNYPAAQQDLELVRTFAGKMTTPMTIQLDASNAVDELLKQRRYSLLFEGGHSWIDARRYNRLDSLPLDTDGDFPHFHVEHYPIPQPELDARK